MSIEKDNDLIELLDDAKLSQSDAQYRAKMKFNKPKRFSIKKIMAGVTKKTGTINLSDWFLKEISSEIDFRNDKPVYVVYKNGGLEPLLIMHLNEEKYNPKLFLNDNPMLVSEDSSLEQENAKLLADGLNQVANDEEKIKVASKLYELIDNQQYQELFPFIEINLTSLTQRLSKECYLADRQVYDKNENAYNKIRVYLERVNKLNGSLEKATDLGVEERLKIQNEITICLQEICSLLLNCDLYEMPLGRGK